MVVTEKEFFFYRLHANASFWRHNLRRQTKHEHHGIDVQRLTCEALERQKQKIGKSK